MLRQDSVYPLLADFTVAFVKEGQGKVGVHQSLLLICNSHGDAIMEEIAMVIFSKEGNNSRRGPSETMPLTETLAAAIWSAEDENGQVRYHWDISRLSADGSRTYKTKRIESLIEMPEFICKLCEAFANSSAVSADLRNKLALQAAALKECAKLTKASDVPKVNGQDSSNRVFAA